MSRLTDQQARFVEHFVAQNGNAAEAARRAGYADASARTSAYRLLRTPEVRGAIRERMSATLAVLGHKALGVIEQILDDPGAPAGVRLDAAKTALDRCGFPALRSPAALETSDGKLLSEMSIAELEAIVSNGQDFFRRLRQQAMTVEMESCDDDGPANQAIATRAPA